MWIGRARVRHLQWREAPDHFPRHMQWLPAGSEHTDVSARAQYTEHEVRTRRFQVLAVVQHEQELATAQTIQQCAENGTPGLLVNVENSANHLRHELWVRQTG